MIYIERRFCTGCRLCKKECPSDAIKIINYKAYIDYSKCSECYRCVYVCPSSAIKRKTSTKASKTQLKKDLSNIGDKVKEIKSSLDKIEKR